MIEPDGAEFVDHDKRVGEFGRAQQAVDEARLARAEKPGDEINRNRAQGPTGISFPTNTGAPEGCPVGEPPSGSIVTA